VCKGFVLNHVSDRIPSLDEVVYHLIKYNMTDCKRDYTGILQKFSSINAKIEDTVVYKFSAVPKGDVAFDGVFEGRVCEFEVRKADTTIFNPTIRNGRMAFPVIAIIRDMIVISSSIWFNGDPPNMFLAYGMRVGAAYRDIMEQFPVRFTKLEALDYKDQNYMPDTFRPVSVRSGLIGSVCSELLSPKYNVDYAQVCFRSPDVRLLVDVRLKLTGCL
jgi:hypothetical protein